MANDGQVVSVNSVVQSGASATGVGKIYVCSPDRQQQLSTTQVSSKDSQVQRTES